MADVSGLEVAFETWQNLQDNHRDPALPGLNLKPEQLFFLHAAQVSICICKLNNYLLPLKYLFLITLDFTTQVYINKYKEKV